ISKAEVCPWIHGEKHMYTDRPASMASMTLCHLVRMARKAVAARPRISRIGCHNGVDSQLGFTLLEIVCVLAIVAALAAILLPRMPGGTSRPRLEAYALETASLLAVDHNAAIRQRVQISTNVNATARLVRSGATGRMVRVPDDVVFDAVLPKL